MDVHIQNPCVPGKTLCKKIIRVGREGGTVLGARDTSNCAKCNAVVDACRHENVRNRFCSGCNQAVVVRRAISNKDFERSGMDQWLDAVRADAARDGAEEGASDRDA